MKYNRCDIVRLKQDGILYMIVAINTATGTYQLDDGNWYEDKEFEVE
jgi:hypothetical protein